jgi:hypothetical protein
MKNHNQKRMQWIKFPKGTSRKQKALALQAQRAELGLEPWTPPEPKPVKQKWVPYALKHKDHNLTIINGKWGPHTKKVVCLDCDGAFVMWARKSR